MPTTLPNADDPYKWNRHQTLDYLRQISTTNRPKVRALLLAKQRQSRKPSTLAMNALAFRDLDRLVNGTDFDALTPVTLARCAEAYAATHKPATLYTWCAVVASYYTHRDGTGRVPRDVREALRVPKPKPTPQLVIERDELERLLQDANQRQNPRYAARFLALVWLLWDSGARPSELLSLRIQDVNVHQDTATLDLPPLEEGGLLKTGPRSIEISEALPALNLWLSMHPRKDEPSAFLLPNRNGFNRLFADDAQALIERACKRAGLRRMTPKLFRHTRATRAAEAGWSVFEMNDYFGWGPNSKMAFSYVHKAQTNIRQKVREAAGLDEVHARVRADPQQAMAEAIALAIQMADARRKPATSA